MYYIISDVVAYVWFMDIDPHSLASPYFTADERAELAGGFRECPYSVLRT